MLLRAERVEEAAIYRLVACGVDAGSGADPLHYAEKDAINVATFFTSGLGPLDHEDVSLLLGTRGTGTLARLDRTLADLELLRPDFLVLYFSLHGNRDGILLADGLYPHRQLARRLGRISASSSVVILDTCSAASFEKARIEVGGLIEGIRDLAWFEMLAEATPGTRLMFSTGHGRLAGEGGIVPGGHFTTAFLRALQRGRGDICLDDMCWVSDEKAFALAKRIMRSEFRTPQLPVALRLTGDFPLGLSQAAAPVGKAAIGRPRLRSGGDALNVNLLVRGRRYLPTRFRWRLRNFTGVDVATDVQRVRVSDEESEYTASIPLPRLDHLSRLFPIEVVVRVEDQFARPLARRVVPLSYS